MSKNITETSIKNNYELIMDYETQFAHSIASEVIERPKTSIWMILIPIIFVHHFYAINRYGRGRKVFVDKFIISRKRTLDAAIKAVRSGSNPHIKELVEQANIPEAAQKSYSLWLRFLCDHYMDLLKANGDTYSLLVKSAYKSRMNYLLFVNRLNKLERDFNAVIKSHLYDSVESVDDIVKKMELACEEIRRDKAEKVFDA